MRWGWIVLCLAVAAPLPAKALSLMGAPRTDQLIVRLKPKGVQLQSLSTPQIMSVSQAKTFSALAGVAISPYRESAAGQVVKLAHVMPMADVNAIARKIAASPDVLYAEPDTLLFPLALPNDPLYAQQWNLHNPATDLGGIGLPAAWDVTTGLPGVIVAVVDNGILNHADLSGRIVPGYDFISDVSRSNDGDGRDADPTDPGDWVSAAEAAEAADGGALAGCEVSDSSWHGTHVAGIVGAASNNGAGITGVGWGTRILPVRAVGKCGGYVSDITDGMRWAAGLSVTGVPTNPNPARVINLSLGGAAPCSVTEQSAIDAVVAAGTTVVVAAGNEARDAATVSPANCKHVVVVAATDRTGARASYTNFGAVVDVSAPGGDSAYGGGAILSTGDGGTTAALHDNAYSLMEGTSMAAPHVSGVISLLLSANPALQPSAVEQILTASSRVFPIGTSWNCTTAACGAGIVDAAAAVAVAKALAGAGAGQYVGVPGGVPAAQNLVAAIQPLAADLNQANQVYAAARVGDQWYFLSGGNWLHWTTGDFPVYRTLVPDGPIVFPLGRGQDVSGNIGTEVYVGYGRNVADMLDNHKYGLIYTIH